MFLTKLVSGYFVFVVSREEHSIYKMKRAAFEQYLIKKRKEGEAASVASLNLKDEVLAEFREAFAKFDGDNSGSISAGELGKVMRMLGDNPSVVEVAALAADGGEQRLELDLAFEKSGLTARELAVELERVKRRNRYLMRLIEKQRIEAFRERQRKRIEVGAEQEN